MQLPQQQQQQQPKRQRQWQWQQKDDQQQFQKKKCIALATTLEARNSGQAACRGGFRNPGEADRVRVSGSPIPGFLRWSGTRWV